MGICVLAQGSRVRSAKYCSSQEFLELGRAAAGLSLKHGRGDRPMTRPARRREDVALWQVLFTVADPRLTRKACLAKPGYGGPALIMYGKCDRRDARHVGALMRQMSFTVAGSMPESCCKASIRRETVCVGCVCVCGGGGV